MRILMLFCHSLMLCCLVNVVLVSGQCLTDQKTLLLQLRESLTVLQYSVSTKLDGWDKDGDCCFWAGVTCDSSFGHVIGLDLSQESISGGINETSSLFSLRFLERLSLAKNHISGQLPSNFGKLTSLKHLNLSASGFDGQIPSDFSKLTSLVSLDLSGYSWFPHGFLFDNPNLEFLFQNLTSLRELYLDGIDFSAQGLEYLCRVLSSSQPDLQVLSLSGCNLSGPIDSSLTKLKSLSVIRLDYNNFPGRIPEFFADFPNLTVLSLSSCELSGAVPDKLFQVPTLQTIDLSGNDLRGSLPEFPVDSSLQNLMLRLTNFSGNLPDSIGNLRMLSTLDLSLSNFTGPIPRSVESLAHLVNVELSTNHFSGSIPSFNFSINLTVLNLGSNRFSGNISFFQVGTFENLVELDLSGNALEGQIPGNLFSMPTLEKLILSSNSFSGPIPEVVARNSSLTIIELYGNKLEGPVPEFLFHLDNLFYLDLSSNQFNETIDLIRFASLPLLFFLDLSYNKLVVNTNSTFLEPRPLPLLRRLMLASCGIRNFPNLQKQYALRQLDLSNNELTGEIPAWIWDLGDAWAFRSLDLSHNQFTHIQQPQSFVPLEFLDLSSNSLTGQLAADIGIYLPKLAYFSIANNRFSGSIPASLCNVSSLTEIDFSNNTFSNTIPSCLLNHGNRNLLNLGRNNLTGKIPDISIPISSLGALDLSFNHLEGQIPSSLSNFRSLVILNLGGNRIDDNFPCWINNLTFLRVLVLRNNRFHGSISCPGNNYTWPNVQVLDLAENSFIGALPAVLFSSLKVLTAEGDDPTVQFILLQSEHKDIQVTYHDSVTMVIKGGETEVNRNLLILTSIDFSSNHFQGNLPDTLGELRWVHLLNFSHNYLTGPIPSSIGNMKKLESLDLSSNLLRGKIPLQVSGLTSISTFNLSYNLLYGPIPSGPQIQALSESNFLGNRGLCGLPLNVPCNSHSPGEVPVSSPEDKESAVSDSDVYFSAAIGFVTSLSVMYWSLLCNKKWRKWYDHHLNRFVPRFLSMTGHGV